MKKVFWLAALLVGSSVLPGLSAQNDSGATASEISPADAKKLAAQEKRKARLIKDIEKQVSSTERKLKLREDQKEKVHSYLNQYYVQRLPMIAVFRRAEEREEKKAAKKELRQWNGKLERKLAEILDEKQMKSLTRILEADMEALKPRPSGGGGGGGGGGDFGGGGDGGGGDD